MGPSVQLEAMVGFLRKNIKECSVKVIEKFNFNGSSLLLLICKKIVLLKVNCYGIDY